MRIITDKEDKLLEKINLCRGEIKKLEIEEIELKGTLNECREKRQAEFTKVMFWIVISSLFFVLAMGYFIVGINTPVLAASIFFASGGIGFIILAVWIITLVVFIGFIKKTSRSKHAKLKNCDNISFVEDKTVAELNKLYDRMTQFRTASEIAQTEYDELKNELDDLYEKGVIDDNKIIAELNSAKDAIWQGNKYSQQEIIKGQDNFSVNTIVQGNVANYKTYEPWVNDDSSRGNYNKLRAELTRIQNQRNRFEDDLSSDEARYLNAKKVLIYSIVFIAVILVAILVAAIQTLTSPEILGMGITVVSVLAVVFVASITVFFFIMAYTYPTVSSNGLAGFLVKLTGNEHIKLKMDKLEQEVDSIDRRVIEIKEEMRLLKSEIDKEKNDLPYLY